MTKTLASVPHHAARPAAQVGRASRRRYSLASLQSMIAAWREQTRFRWDLRRISEANPHLIDDIGLTKRQVEEEIAKLPFWQR
ncbi:DUF1127 domain-containing protein [Mesorhizobium tamadayense]|uniref:DUF1127 domain-containing protein n=1 Tax=Mesorhizobium tamadayense TaxID=425306 RepID=A0A3P3G1J5_9HYPH|nr:DUF1127 domain-containing protein [Mesorhizobium tamadayense]RRI03859.1 DUF1127 domain-containing protein [Mesorhizobium tamadayense]